MTAESAILLRKPKLGSGTHAQCPPTLCFRRLAEPGSTQPELIGDPGNAPPFSRLTNPNQILDAGHLFGLAYGLQPSAQTWAVTAGSNTQAGTYSFVCSIHDWMTGQLEV